MRPNEKDLQVLLLFVTLLLQHILLTQFNLASRTFLHDKGSDMEFHSNKGTSEHQRRRGKESSCFPSGFFASESPSEEGYGHSWESEDWYSTFTDDS